MYAVLVSQDASDDKSVYAIEAYADQEAFDSHMNTKGVKDMIAWVTTNDVLAAPPTVHQLEAIPGLTFSRPTILTAKNPHIVVAELSYRPGYAEASLPYWKAVVQSSQNNEPGTLVYGICKDVKDPDKLFTVEAYESKDYLMGVHVKSQAISESIKHTKDWRLSLKHTLLRLEAGFLHRESDVAKSKGW